jgi:hypothetical protein
MPAVNVPVSFEYGAIQKELFTNNYGYITLEDVPLNASIHSYQLVENEKANINNLQTDERPEYTLFIEKQIPKGDLSIYVKDHLGNAVPHIPVNVSQEEKLQLLTTDTEGRVILPKVKEGSSVKVSAEVAGASAQAATLFNLGSPELTLRLSAPVKAIPTNGDLRLLFVDNKKNPLPGLPVSVGINGAKTNYETDKSGRLLLQDIPFVPLDINTQRDNISYKGRTLHTPSMGEQVLQLKKKSKWWLWMLLLLLLLAMLWLLLHYLNRPTPPQPPSPQPTRTMTIHVVDQDTKLDINQAQVQMASPQETVLTNGFGKAELTNVKASNQVTVSATGYEQTSDQVDCCNERTIYLRPTVKYCSRDEFNFMHGSKVDTWDIGERSTSFVLEYTTLEIPDDFFVYEGKGTSGKLLWSSVGIRSCSVCDSSRKNFQHQEFRNDPSNRYITVQVKGSEDRDSTGEYLSKWSYNINRCK